MEGRIIKAYGGFFYVHNGEEVIPCKARGIFRKNNEKPIVGDLVEMEKVASTETEGNVLRILPRKNLLIRPEAANVDQIFLLFAATYPEPNMDMLNRFLVMTHDADVPVHLIVNKADLCTPERHDKLLECFRNSPYTLHFISAKEKTGIRETEALLKGKLTVLSGPSGAGKSSFLNVLLGDTHQVLKTGELTRKLERGKNTTRSSEIYFLGDETYVIDTPGFTSIDPDFVLPENLPLYFDEFIPYITKCRFSSCTHISEKGCALREAVIGGKVAKARYLSYTHIYHYLQDIRRY